MLTTIIWFAFFALAIQNLGFKKAVLFTILAGSVGFVAEWLSLNYGVFFGGFYYYSSQLGLQFWGVPWSVIGYWAAFIFAAMGVTNYFFSKYKSFWDAILTTLIDLPLELVALKTKAWTWERGYAPIGNYVGWFLVAFLVSLIFRKFHKKIFKNKYVIALYLLIIILLVLSLV